jgi:hypothetical protein
MSKPLLSILIPTVIGREESLRELVFNLVKQSKSALDYALDRCGMLQIEDGLGFGFCCPHDNDGGVECFYYRDNKEMTIGEKREKLYAAANGLFSLQIDDDDSIHENGITLILEAIKSNPKIPCITYREKCMMNGVYKRSNHSITYSQWMDNQDGYDYVRSPFYKDVIRTDIAKSVPFERIRYNEDERWSYAIKPFLDQEIHIDEEIYHYIYNETNHQERYGYDRD